MNRAWYSASWTPAKQTEFGKLLVDAGQLPQDYAQQRANVVESTGAGGHG